MKDNGKIEVYLLDSDDSRFTVKARAEGRDYVRSDNNVYLAVLPKPDHRSFDTVCIEHYYIDEDLMREDKAGRRIYLSREFDRETGFHLENKELRSGKLSVLSKSDHEIITDSVLDRHDCNHALSKNDFCQSSIRQRQDSPWNGLFAFQSHIQYAFRNPKQRSPSGKLLNDFFE